jgi:peptidoglycan/xylan/chitin deacetylase (PgdA/CDA1 family)
LFHVGRRALDRHRGAAAIVASCPRVTEPLVALTFDDGPSRWTEPLLDLLRRHGAQATFFVLGVSIPGNESILRRIVADGHEVGNHTHNHIDLAEASDEAVLAEIRSCANAIAAVLGTEPRLLRPPYGSGAERVARAAGGLSVGPVVMWSVDPADWRRPEAEPIVDQVLKEIAAGAIVDLHDGIPPNSAGEPSRQATVDAVARLLPELQKRGFELVTVSRLLDAAA